MQEYSILYMMGLTRSSLVPLVMMRISMIGFEGFIVILGGWNFLGL
jgi:hypothetical protein